MTDPEREEIRMIKLGSEIVDLKAKLAISEKRASEAERTFADLRNLIAVNLAANAELQRERDEAIKAKENWQAAFDQIAEAKDDMESERDEAVRRAEEAERLVYVPGVWCCAKCNFTLVQSNLNMLDGSITARNEAGDHCPNCDAPLWRVSERQARKDMTDRCEKLQSERDSARAAFRPAPI